MIEQSQQGVTRQRASYLLWAALPLLGPGYQIAAKNTALILTGHRFDLDLLITALHTPWALAILVFDIAGFLAWMVVLSAYKLSEAFPLSALSYPMVILVSWVLFHEPGSPIQVLGGTIIMTGVWLIGRDSEDD